VTLRGVPYLLWRAVDQHGAELDILLQKCRDKAAAKRFFKRVLASCAEAPRKIVTDQLRCYPAAKAEIPALAHVKHVFVKASARINNWAGNSHQPTRERATHGVASAILNARRLSYRAPVRSGSTSLSSDTYYAPHSIANSSPHASPPGIVSLRQPKIRPFSEQACVLPAIALRTI
jgi:transposase-like protein